MCRLLCPYCASSPSLCSAGWLKGGEGRRKKLASASLALVLLLSSGCSTQPEKVPLPLPVLSSLVRMDRGGQPGVWMNDADAANLALWLEAVCR